MKQRKAWAAAFAAVAMFAVAACGSDEAATEEVTEETEAATEETMAPAEDYSMVKAAVVYITTPGDKGWSYMHDQGIAFMESELRSEEHTSELQSH